MGTVGQSLRDRKWRLVDRCAFVALRRGNAHAEVAFRSVKMPRAPDDCGLQTSWYTGLARWPLMLRLCGLVES